ncbi:hydrolase [Streptomyces fumigatiscleroticus]|nr:hydrolase [Streptomyces fumigatiscleroticus]
MPAPHTPGTAPAPDIRLVVTDLDGTLLDGEGRIPDALWPLLAELRRRGIVFCPASGRQYATLARQFRRAAEDMVFIAENGTYVVQGGRELSSAPLARPFADRVVRTVRTLPAGADAGIVVCGKRSAYVERTDPAFLAEVGRYYTRLETVADATAVDDEIIKLAVFDFGNIEDITAPVLKEFAATHQVVLSGAHWVDLMDPAANKGAAVRRLQRRLGITPEQTVVFGDYLNDLEMLDAATWSFATANAHPEVRLRARRTAPSNEDNGVVETVTRLLGLRPPGTD